MLGETGDFQTGTAAAAGDRQAEVLAAALDLLVVGGERAVTTAAVARAANCSKESLYKWFGDREGLLAAMVGYQASKVRIATDSPAGEGEASLRTRLEAFARDLLDVLAGEVSLALNRMAIADAAKVDGRLGRLVLERGRRQIGARAGQLLDSGLKSGFLAYRDRDEAFRTLYGLIVGDLHVRLLLGDAPVGAERDFDAAARRAVAQFFHLYGNTGTERSPAMSSN